MDKEKTKLFSECEFKLHDFANIEEIIKTYILPPKQTNNLTIYNKNEKFFKTKTYNLH